MNVIVGVAKETIESNVLSSMREKWSDKLVSTINNRNIATIFGEKVYCLGAKDKRQESIFRGKTIKYLYVDEYADISEVVFNILPSRLSLPYSIADMTANPKYPEHFSEQFINKPNRDIYVQRWTLYDNPFLASEVLKNIENDYRGTVFFDRYVLGKPTRAEGLIYSIFADNQDSYITDKPDYDFINIGVDFGGNGSYHSFTATGIKNDYSKLTVLKTQRIDPKNSTPENLYKWFGEFINIVINKYGYINFVFCDSAEQVLIQGLRTHFPKLKIKNARKDEIINRIRCTTALMASKRLFITKDCESLKKAFCSAVYDDKAKDDKRLDNGTSDIDSLDSFEYSFEPYINKLIKWGC